MTASRNHQDLLSVIIKWCDRREDRSRFIVLTDNNELGIERPPTIEGYIPDLVWIDGKSRYRFIGEAKTKDDISTVHSRRQFSTYLNTLELQRHGELVLGVPWDMMGTARSLLAYLAKQLDIESRRWVVVSNDPRTLEDAYGKAHSSR